MIKPYSLPRITKPYSWMTRETVQTSAHEYCEIVKETLTDGSKVYAVESVNLVRFECIDLALAEKLADAIDSCVDVVTL